MYLRFALLITNYLLLSLKPFNGLFLNHVNQHLRRRSPPPLDQPHRITEKKHPATTGLLLHNREILPSTNKKVRLPHELLLCYRPAQPIPIKQQKHCLSARERQVVKLELLSKISSVRVDRPSATDRTFNPAYIGTK